MSATHERLDPLDVPAGVQRIVPGAGGLPIATYEYGNPDGPAILFIHGFMQSHLCWFQQYTDPALADGYRIVALDLRGHGDSGRDLPAPPAPDVPPGHASTDYAGDVHAVIAELALESPTLVGWSYGGLVIGDYLRAHGTSAIGGLVFAGAACRLNPPAQEDTFIGPGFLGHGGGLFNPEMTALIGGTVGFLHDCFHVPLPPREFAWHLAYNMAVPPANRLALIARPGECFDQEVLPGVEVPALVVHGKDDTVVFPASGEAIAGVIAGAELRLYDDCAHAPFLEHPEMFNRDLHAFLGA